MKGKSNYPMEGLGYMVFHKVQWYGSASHQNLGKREKRNTNLRNWGKGGNAKKLRGYK